MSTAQSAAKTSVQSTQGHRVMMMVFVVFITTIVTTRLGYMSGDSPLPVCMALVPGFAFLALVMGYARVDVVALILFLGVIVVGSLTTMFFPEGGSIMSFLLLAVIYCPFLVFFPVDPKSFKRFNDLAVRAATVFAILGILQFCAQFVVSPRHMLFSWAFFMPSPFLVEFNTINELWYGSPILKANAFFFLESSMLGIFLARFLALAVVSGDRWISCGIIGVALVISYSATAWMTFIAFMLPHFFSIRSSRDVTQRLIMVGLGLVAIITLLLLSEALHLDRYMDRVSELTDSRPNSSGGQRFRIPIQKTTEFLFTGDNRQLLIGNGPGTVELFMHVGGVYGNAPTWSKLFIEYGLFGVLAFFLLIARVITRAQSYFPVVFMLMFEMLIVSPGMLVASSVSILYLGFCAVTPTRSVRPIRRRAPNKRAAFIAPPPVTLPAPAASTAR